MKRLLVRPRPTKGQDRSQFSMIALATALLFTLVAPLGSPSHASPAKPRQIWPVVEAVEVDPSSPGARRFRAHHAEAASRAPHVDLAGPWSWYAANFSALGTPPWGIKHQDITVDLDAAKGTLKTKILATFEFNEAVDQLQLVTGAVKTATVTGPNGAPWGAKLTALSGMTLLAIALPESPTLGTSITFEVNTLAELDCSPQGIGLRPCGISGTYHWVTFHRYFLQAAMMGHAPFTSDLHVITAADKVAGAPGLASGPDTLPDGRKLYHFKQVERTDNAGFAIASYSPYVAQLSGGQPLRVYAVGKYVPYADDIAKLVIDVTSWYGERFAKFPWASLNIMQLENNFGGGYAPLSAVFMFRDVFAAQPGTGHWEETVELTAHEVGHQWWGNFVEPYTSGDVALSESLAEESSCWYTEKTLQSRQQMVGNHLSYLYTVPSSQDIAVGSQNVYGSPHYVPVVYHKGSAVFDMLRELIGDEAMAKGFSLYSDGFARDYAKLNDLRLAMEQAAGMKLDWFWQQWLFKTGPIQAEVAGRLVGQGDKLAVRMKFSQATPKRFTVAVTVDYADGTQLVTPVEVSPVGEAPVIVEVPVKSPPVRVRLDVQRRLLRMWATATPGDFNFSGLVDGADLVELAVRHGRAVRVFGKSGQPFFYGDTAWNELYDLQADLRVDMADVETFSGWVGTESDQF